MEQDYRQEFSTRFGHQFNRLHTITNMPISGFLHALRRDGDYERYMETRAAAFSPSTVDGLMRRSMISVGWDGRLYDCDFNLMLNMGLADAMPAAISAFDPERLASRRIAVGSHCFGCTAGARRGGSVA